MVSGWQSSIEGPIPPHPRYDKKNASDYVPVQPLRVKGDGEEIASKGHRGTVSILLQLDGQGLKPRPSSARTKAPPKDHMKENWRRMRQIQKSSKNREVEKESKQAPPVKALWKSEKYTDVPSRVMESLQKTPPAPRPESTTFLRAHSRAGPPSRPPSRGTGESPRQRPSSAASSVPSAASAKDVQLIHRDVDFIRVNGRSVKNYGIRRSPSASALEELKKKQEEELDTYRKGEVPKYLVHRQKFWKSEEERRKAEAPDPDCPPDHKVMPESDRKETLDLLMENQKKLQEQMNGLPICKDTLRVKQKRREIEEKLAEIEEALKIFSRPKVFVKIDS